MQISISSTDITLPPNASPEAMAALERIMQRLGRTGAAETEISGSEIVMPPVNPVTIAHPAAGEYWAGQGGHYICTLPALHHLPARHLFAGVEENDECAWGRKGGDVPGAASHFDGRANTAALLAHGEHPAAEWAAAYEAGGHRDWYLPSRLELLMCYLAAPDLFQKAGWYWSSSQYSRYDAWCQDFEHGYSHGNGKDTELRARPVRWIPL